MTFAAPIGRVSRAAQNTGTTVWLLLEAADDLPHQAIQLNAEGNSFVTTTCLSAQ
jgi:hypothetical protein